MRSKPARVLLILALSGGLVGGMAPGALAQQEPEAPVEGVSEAAPDEEASVDARYKSLTQQAAKAYADQEYARALELFEQAHALKPVPNLRYNMGRIEEKRGNFEDAMGHYEKFVGLAGVDIEARKDALDRIKTLREVVALQERGKEVDESEIDEKHEDRELASANRVEEPKPVRIERDYTAAYITLGLALASYGTSGYFALQARQASKDFADATTRSARREAASSGETASIVADSTLGLGVVLTGLSVYFLVSPSETEVPADRSAVRLSPQLGADGAGMSFSVEF